MPLNPQRFSRSTGIKTARLMSENYRRRRAREPGRLARYVDVGLKGRAGEKKRERDRQEKGATLTTPLEYIYLYTCEDA